MIRDGFREITSGWMLVDDQHDLAERIDRLIEWACDGHAPLEADEVATIRFMMQSLIARELRARGLGVSFL